MMFDKIKTILGSIRFWIITTGTVSAFLAHISNVGFSGADLFNTISIYLGVIAGVGTIDSAATKMNTNTTVLQTVTKPK